MIFLHNSKKNRSFALDLVENEKNHSLFDYNLSGVGALWVPRKALYSTCRRKY